MRSWNDMPNLVLDQIFAYLSWSDMVNASSTCKSWRYRLYHPRFWNSISFSLTNLNNKDKEEKAKYFIHACGKIVKFVSITFDSLDPLSSVLTDNLLQMLYDNVALKKLMLVPSHCALYPSSTSTLSSSRMYDHFFTILSKADQLEELSIGCLDDIAKDSNKFLQLIASHHSKSIRVLGIASLKYDPEEYIHQSLDYHYLNYFSNLQILSVNYDYVDDNFLQTLHNCSSLKRIVLHVHDNVQYHPGTTEEAWIELTEYCPNVEVRLNIIHAYYAVLKLEKSILKKSMPLTHLRAFFCETLNRKALNKLYIYWNSLRSLWWVDSPLYSDNDVLIKDEFDEDFMDQEYQESMNPFILAAWRCINLEEIVLFGYKYFANDLQAIGRLRGQVLKKLDVLKSEMILMSFGPSRREIEQDVSYCMGKSWKTLKKQDVHPVIFFPDKYDSDEYLLPILCSDLEL